MRIGIFGGTFNPPHKGHKAALSAFIQSAKLDRVIVMPSYLPPHKNLPEKTADFSDRLEMCRVAFGDIDLCPVDFSTLEKELCEETGERGYTWITLERLAKDNTSATLCFYVGGDMITSFHSWRRPDVILSLAELWVMPRGDDNDEKILDARKKLVEDFPNSKIFIIDSPTTQGSSTEVRGGNFALLSDRVREYVLKKGLYQ